MVLLAGLIHEALENKAPSQRIVEEEVVLLAGLIHFCVRHPLIYRFYIEEGVVLLAGLQHINPLIRHMEGFR